MTAAVAVETIKISLLLAVLMGCSTSSHCSQAALDRSPTRLSLCSLIITPNSYAAKAVEVTGLITATKEGIRMWDPSCRSRGLDLSIDFALPGNAGFKVLDEALKAHALSDHPVIATIEGRFMPDYDDGTMQRKRTVLLVQRVTKVHQSSAQELR